jgi:hypothetical protein
MNQATLPDVLTIEDTSRYLRLPVEAVLLQALHGKIPGRKIEDDWRFLKVAIDEWLHSPSGQAILLQQRGTLADHVSLAELRKTI